MPTQSFTVSGMTCEHCVKSVTEELSELAGVQNVRVHLESGEVTVTGDQQLTQQDAEKAVAEAGYAVSAWPAAG